MLAQRNSAAASVAKATPRPSARRLTPLLLGLGASGLALLLQLSGLLVEVEHVVVDTMMRLRGDVPADSRVALVAIDERSIDAYGQWPWPRTRMAELIARLSEQGARVVALDVVFAERSRVDERVDLSSEDAALAQAFAAAGNVVAGYYFRAGARPAAATSDGERGSPGNIRSAAFQQVMGDPRCGFAVPWREAWEPNLDALAQAAAWQGFFSNERRPSGKLRSYGLVMAAGEAACADEPGCPAASFCGAHAYFPALALAAVKVATGETLQLEAASGRVPRLRLGERAITTDASGALTVNYRGARNRFPVYPVQEVLEGRIATGVLAGRIVFVGATEPGIGDFQVSPYGVEIPGVEVHAHVADNLLNGDYLAEGFVQTGLSFLAVLLLGPLVALLVSSSSRVLLGSLAATALLAAWPLCGFGAFLAAGWHLQATAPAAAGLGALVAALTWQIGFVDREKRRIKGVFERFVSKSIVDEMLRHPERVRLGGEKRVMTVLFSDIRGFTDLSERADPEQITRVLNRYFTPMTRLVIAEGGTLDKYMGDALMAFFGAPISQPDHAARACRAALAMRDKLPLLNRDWQRDGTLPPGVELGVGIGLATGEMSVGNMGSEEVFDYTVIGDTVNLGSRIEGLNKMYGTAILVAEATAKVVAGAFLLREVDRVRVKGKKLPVTLFEVVAEEPAPAGLKTRMGRFEEALSAYRERRFEVAAAAFEALDRELAEPLCKLYLGRCQKLLAEPPGADWEPVETLKSK